MLAEQTREESKLKYLMYMSLLEPYDKNVDKMFKIEKKRTFTAQLLQEIAS